MISDSKQEILNALNLRMNTNSGLNNEVIIK
jgi:hypothetical protein